MQSCNRLLDMRLRYRCHPQIVATLLLAALIPLLWGCSVPPTAGDSPDMWQQPQSYWQKAAEGVDIAFRLTPPVPGEMSEAYMELFIRDLRGIAPQPLLEAKVKGAAYLAGRPGRVHALKLVQEQEPGRYGTQFKVETRGEWLANFSIRAKDGKRWKVQFPFLISKPHASE